jgi:nucleotide-binding universal stress UspA family protein
MRDIKRILCPTDFSSCSKGALEDAVALAKITGAEVSVLHVYQNPAHMLPMGGYAGPVSDMLADLRTHVAQELEALADAHRKEGARIDVLLVEGIPYKGILDRAEEWSADLIVMGTHGRTGVERALAGSVAERVIRLAPCPVLVTRREA